MSTPTMYVLMGASGSGKSTWAAAQQGARVCSADHYFMDKDGVYRFDPAKLPEAHARCQREAVYAVERSDYAVERGDPAIIIDNTNTTIAEVAFYVTLGTAFGYKVIPLVFEGRYQNVHNVPDKTVFMSRLRLKATLGDWPKYWPAPVMVADWCGND